MPQFHVENFAPQLVWLTIFFAILYFGIVRATLPRLGRTITAREDKVLGDIDAASRAKHGADAMTATYAADIDHAHKAARAAVDAAKARASSEVESAVKTANAVIGEKAAVADTVLSGARSRAMTEIEAVTADAVADIVERLTGKRPASNLASNAAKTALAA